MSDKSIHQPEVAKLMGKLMRLAQGCPALPVATKDDKLYMVYCDPPRMDSKDEEDGIWITVDRKLTATFGIDVIKKNLMQGSLGIELALKYLSRARDHPTWTANSEHLLKYKMEMIAQELITGASDFLEEGPISTDEDKNKARKSSDCISTNKSHGTSTVMKRRVVSQPDVDPEACHSQPKKPAAKRHQLDTPESKEDTIIISSDDEMTQPHKSTSKIVSAPKKPPRVFSQIEKVNLVLSDDEVTQPHNISSNFVSVPKKSIWRSSKVDKAKKAVNVLNNCPLSTPDAPCNQCKIEVNSADKEFQCHCGQKTIVLRGGRTEKVLSHWKTKACTQKTSTLRSNAVLVGFLAKSDGDKQQVKRGFVEINCPGLTDATWDRPQAKHSIRYFLEHTCSIYRGNNQHRICQELFGKDANEKTLSPDEKARLMTTLDARAIWEVKRHGARTGKGLFKDREAVQGLFKSVAVRAERELGGKSLRGMRVDPYLDDCLTTLGAMSRSALNLFSKTFAGRTAQSQRMIEAKSGGKLEPEIHPANFHQIAKNLQELGYAGPISAASDQTVCVKTLRHHNQCLVGAEGGDKPFENDEELKILMKDIVDNDKLCSKIRAYTIQVPLPNIPTYVVALIASCSKEGAKDIADEHAAVIDLAHRSGIMIISMGADVHVKVPLFGNPPRPVVAVQDPKHARKTGANQLLSGSRLLVMGKYTITIQQLAEILKMPNSPLLAKDVFDSDKQDDGRAFRTLSAPTLSASLCLESSTGLTIFLFITGELVDSWLSKTMGHRERIRSAWTAGFFLRRWKGYLQKREKETNDYYPDYPFCPWKHGTESCEHVFGWMRVLSPRFSVLDARFMMPKIHAVVKSVMSGKIKIPPSKHIHSGYQYAFGDEGSLETIKHLRTYPTNAEISEDLTIANQIANSLAHLAGMGPLDPKDDDLPAEEDDLPSDDEDLGPYMTDSSPDISTCATKDYRVHYASKAGDFSEEVAFAKAATLAKEQNTLDLLLDQVPENFETKAIRNAAMSIKNLMNPSGM
ncbi:uncharacterized protein MELLADRAFT_85351 [Melampsora larici-populina 98AG31]|uniref:Uncharacterized protein n=1 Tax=Melampsora larici-populina (strain 98AG31 / pathotype 3-4-7) TaxID=747676 RepID=F4SD33_MELLP|nr:uncharacterized protein MELLADRAFT_85351 [Melampsora larici-populina 98AG31]EGF97440.1 hypothetical protein MELLADRAFT_85351 [Melampsora larici-populina 98AG31]